MFTNIDQIKAVYWTVYLSVKCLLVTCLVFVLYSFFRKIFKYFFAHKHFEHSENKLHLFERSCFKHRPWWIIINWKIRIKLYRGGKSTLLFCIKKSFSSDLVKLIRVPFYVIKLYNETQRNCGKLRRNFYNFICIWWCYKEYKNSILVT